MKLRKHISLRLRLALLFSLVSAVLFALMGIYVFKSLEREISYRDDIALLGRVDRIKQLIQDTKSIEILQKYPQLYANMLGSQEDVLWIINQSGNVLIEINPAHLSRPDTRADTPAITGPVLFNTDSPNPARLARISTQEGNARIFVIAGKLLRERELMMAAYRRNLGLAWLAGVVLAFVLGWEAVRRGLIPLARLGKQAAAIDPHHLGVRIDDQRQPQELQALTVALNLMLERLEEGYARLTRFSEDLAHEMRTPLNNLMLQNQLALQQPLSVEDYGDLLASQQEEYERVARMIDSMLFLARAEKQESAPQWERVDLEGLAQQLVEYFEGMAQERGMWIETDVHGELHADAALVRRALANLLANAIRYGDADTPIVLRTSEQPDGLEIAVSNQGAPIGSEHLPRLFDRFYRCDASRSNPDDSGGLGLAIVQSIMLMHHGEVRVESTEASTTFTLRFRKPYGSLRSAPTD